MKNKNLLYQWGKNENWLFREPRVVFGARDPEASSAPPPASNEKKKDKNKEGDEKKKDSFQDKAERSKAKIIENVIKGLKEKIEDKAEEVKQTIERATLKVAGWTEKDVNGVKTINIDSKALIEKIAELEVKLDPVINIAVARKKAPETEAEKKARKEENKKNKTLSNLHEDALAVHLLMEEKKFLEANKGKNVEALNTELKTKETELKKKTLAVQVAQDKYNKNKTEANKKVLIKAGIELDLAQADVDSYRTLIGMKDPKTLAAMGFFVDKYGVLKRIATQESIKEKTKEANKKSVEIFENTGLRVSEFVHAYFVKNLDSGENAVGKWDSVDKLKSAIATCDMAINDASKITEDDLIFIKKQIELRRGQNEDAVRDRINAKEIKKNENVIEEAFGKLKDSMFSGDTEDMVTSWGLVLGAVLTLRGSKRGKDFLKYGVMAIFGHKFLKEQMGVDLMEKFSLSSDADLFRGTSYQAQLDDLERNQEQLNPSGWEKTALKSDKKSIVMSQMSDLPMNGLIDWYQTAKGLAGTTNNEKAREVIFNDSIPKGLENALEEVRRAKFPNAKDMDLELAEVALGILGLYFKENALKEGKGVNTENGIKSTEEHIERVGGVLNKGKDKVLLGDLTDSRMSSSSRELSIKQNRTLDQVMSNFVIETWKAKGQLLPETLKDDKIETLLKYNLQVENWSRSGFYTVQDLVDKGYQVGKIEGERLKQYIELGLANNRENIALAQDLAGRMFMAPVNFTGDVIEFAAEQLPEMIENVKYYGFEVASRMWNKVSEVITEPEKEVVIENGTDLAQVLTKAKILNQVQNAYGLIDALDVEKVCNLLISENKFVPLVNQMYDKMGIKEKYVVGQKIKQGEIARLFLNGYFYETGSSTLGSANAHPEIAKLIKEQKIMTHNVFVEKIKGAFNSMNEKQKKALVSQEVLEDFLNDKNMVGGLYLQYRDAESRQKGSGNKVILDQLKK